MRVSWLTQPTLRIGSSAGIQLDKTANTWLDGCVVGNSNGAGVNCWVCVSPKVTNTTVANTTSNGFMFANCQTPTVLNCTSTNSWDDGFEFTRYNGMPAQLGRLRPQFGRPTIACTRYFGQRTILRRNQQLQHRRNVGKRYSLRDRLHVPHTGPRIGPLHQRHHSATPEQYYRSKATNSASRFPMPRALPSPQSQRSAAQTAASAQTHRPDRVLVAGRSWSQSNLRDSGANLQAKQLSIDLLRTENAPAYGIFISRLSERLCAQARDVECRSQAFSLRRAIWLENNTQINVQSLGIFDNQAYVPPGTLPVASVPTKSVPLPASHPVSQAARQFRSTLPAAPASR